MRKKLFVLAALWGLCTPFFAATDMCVIKKNGEIVKFDVEEVKEVIYQKQTDSPIIETPAVDAASSDLRYFILNDNEVEVTGFINGSANIVVPARVNISGKTYTVTRIGEGAFEDQTRIKTVTLPNTIKTIGESAFEGCENLTGINIPSSVTAIEDDAFEDCESLKNVELPDGLNYIGYNAFQGCLGLTSITIPSSVTTIEGLAFDNCNNLKPELLIYADGTKCYGWVGPKEKCTNIEIPEGVITIGDYAFDFSDELRNNNYLTSITIPSTVTSIGEYSFFRCLNLTKVTIPSSVTSIGHAAFAQCENLDVVIDNIQENIKFYSYDENDQTVQTTMEKSNAFYNCKSVKFNNGILAGEGTIIVESEYLNVVEGGKYVAYNPSIDGGELRFEVNDVYGSAGLKVVKFIVHRDGDDWADGSEFVISDEGCSYFGIIDGRLQELRKSEADANAPNVIFALSYSTSEYRIVSPTENTTLSKNGAFKTTFGTLTTAGSSTDKPNVDLSDSAEEIQVKAGGTYYASNYIKDFTFKVKGVYGSYLNKNQIVEFEIDGELFELSDAGASYLMWTGNRFEAVGKAVADANAESVVMVLACANSSADYTFVSPTHNATLYSMGARKTLFSNNQKDAEVQTSYDEIQVKVGGTYCASNPVKDFTFKVMSVSGHYVDQSQVVIIRIEGVDYELSDAGDSFLMWTGQEFVTANTSTARNGAKNVVACLSLVNSQADYTIMSATKVSTLKSLGANQTLFSTSSSTVDVQPTTSITAKAGDVYMISNSKLNGSTTMTIDKVEGTTVTVTVSGFGTVTIGSAYEDKSYAIVYDGEVVAASMSEAKTSPERVLFICKSGSVLASGTLASSDIIYSQAGETTFVER